MPVVDLDLEIVIPRVNASQRSWNLRGPRDIPPAPFATLVIFLVFFSPSISGEPYLLLGVFVI